MGLTHKVINSLYLEAMVLADEARAYFDQFGREARDGMTPLQRVSFSCESLKVTTRLMHIIAWLLGQRSMDESFGIQQPLGSAAESDRAVLAGLPEDARVIIVASEDLYIQVKRLEFQMAKRTEADNPARSLLARLERSF
jgi:regulator of CtrA degradation